MRKPLFTRRNCAECLVTIVVVLLGLWALCVGLAGLAEGQGPEPEPLNFDDMTAFCRWGGHADAILWTGGAHGWACVNATNQVWMVDAIYDGYNSACTVRDGVPSIADNEIDDPYRWFCRPDPAKPQPPELDSTLAPPPDVPVAPEPTAVPTEVAPQAEVHTSGHALEELRLHQAVLTVLSTCQDVWNRVVHGLP